MKELEYFTFEKLAVWEKAVDYGILVINVIDTIDLERKHFRLIEQLESCSVSIASNIAEGKGRWSKKEFKQFLYYSRGSLYESLTQLTIFYKNEWIREIDFNHLRDKAVEINKMLNSLIYSINNSID